MVFLTGFFFLEIEVIYYNVIKPTINARLQRKTSAPISATVHFALFRDINVTVCHKYAPKGVIVRMPCLCTEQCQTLTTRIFNSLSPKKQAFCFSNKNRKQESPYYRVKNHLAFSVLRP